MEWHKITITELTTTDYPYDLLLLADETKQAIDRYIQECKVFLITLENQLIAQYSIYPLDLLTWEIKNISILPAYQNQGLGSYLIQVIKTQAAQQGIQKILVGTGDQSLQQIRFYEHNGFSYAFARKNFFIENYETPIVENGKELRDMIVLSWTV